MVIHSRVKRATALVMIPGGGGGMTLISQTVAESAVANFDLTSIPGTYESLRLVIQARGDTAATGTPMLLRFNNDSGANYNWQRDYAAGATGQDSGAGATSVTAGYLVAATAPSGDALTSDILIPGYARTVFNKSFVVVSTSRIATGSSGVISSNIGGYWNSTAAITRITLIPTAGNFITDSVVSLYGMVGP